MHNNYFFLRKLAAELNDLLQGEELLVCFSQEKEELIFGFSNETYLKCILKSDFSALTVMNDFSRARKNSVSLWPRLYGLKVITIRVCDYERAVRIDLESENVLVIKFFGNRPNVLFYSKGEQIHIFNNHLLADRNLKLSDFDREMKVDFDRFALHENDWQKLFFVLGKEAIAELKPQLENKMLSEKWDKIQSLLTYLQNPDFYLDFNGGIPTLSLFKDQKQSSAIEAVNAFVIAYLKTSGFDFLKNGLTSRLNKEISKTRNYIARAQSRQKTLQAGMKSDEIGHILMANLHLIEQGAEEVELLNFYNNTPILIKLKKDYSPQKNAEVYYRKAKNEKIEAEVIAQNLESANQRLNDWIILLDKVSGSDSFKELKNIEKELVGNTKNSGSEEFPFNEVVFRGVKIWIGRNAKNNDLLLQTANKNDIWLHARGTTGSHVIIKSPKPNAEVLEFAASLAAYYSKRRTEGLVAVTYTPKKFVRKAKNLPAGQVIVEKEETILVEPRSR